MTFRSRATTSGFAIRVPQRAPASPTEARAVPAADHHVQLQQVLQILAALRRAISFVLVLLRRERVFRRRKVFFLSCQQRRLVVAQGERRVRLVH